MSTKRWPWRPQIILSNHPYAGYTDVLIGAYRKSQGVLTGRLAHALSLRKENVPINAFLDKYRSGPENDLLGYSLSLVNIALLGTPESRRIVQESLKFIQGLGDYDRGAAGMIFTANLTAGTDIHTLFEFCNENSERRKFIPSLLIQIAKHCGAWYSVEDLTEEIEKKMFKRELPYVVEESLDIIEEYRT